MQSGIALGKFGSCGEEIAKFSKNANSIAKTVGDLFFGFWQISRMQTLFAKLLELLRRL